MIKRSSRRMLGVAAAVTLALVACGGNPFGPDPRDVEFAASLEIDLATMTETASGLFFRDVVVGTGEPAAIGDQVTLSYTGWLVDGETFDSNQAFPVTLGETNLIDGFTEGIVGMRLGGTRMIVIPANLGYGSQAYRSIPGDAVLVFELTITALVKA